MSAKSGTERDERFRRLCANFGLAEVAREETPFGTILIGEAYKNACPEYERPCYAVLWYVRRGGNDDVAQRLYFDFGRNTREGRINAALATARQFVTDSARVGFYDR